LDDDWIMIDGRPYFVAGYTPGGVPYGIYLDEMDDDYLTEMITPGRPGKVSDLEIFWSLSTDTARVRSLWRRLRPVDRHHYLI